MLYFLEMYFFLLILQHPGLEINRCLEHEQIVQKKFLIKALAIAIRTIAIAIAIAAKKAIE